MLKFLRWVLGYRSITVKQSLGRRVWSIAAENHIFLWDIHQSKDSFTASVSTRNYPLLLELLQSNAILPQTSPAYGAQSTLFRYRKRVGIVVGLAAVVAGFFAAQQFVWTVRIEGVSPETELAIRQVLPSLNVRAGAAKNSLDTYWIPISLRLECPNLCWAALNLYGTTAIVRAREVTPPPEAIDTQIPANVVAAYDGQIVRVSVTDGRALVQQNDVVQKGQILITGVWQDRWGMTHLCRANGKIQAKVPMHITVKVARQRMGAALTGKILVRRTLTCFGRDIPLSFGKIPVEQCKIEQQRTPFTLFGLPLPATLATERFVFYNPITLSRTQEQALTIAHRQLLAEERLQLGDGEIYQRELESVTEEDSLTLIARYTVLRDIGLQQEIAMQPKTNQTEKAAEG